MSATAQITERDTVTASGEYNLSAIMRLALAKARREFARSKQYGITFARELRDALKNVWNFARSYRWTIRQRIEREASAAPALMQKAA